MCSQIWLSPLVDDPNPPSSHKFEKGNTSLKQPSSYIGKILPKSVFLILKIKNKVVSIARSQKI